MSKIATEREFFREHPGAVFDETWHDIARKVKFAVEDYLECEPELQELYPEHWKEIGLDHDVILLDPDYERYRAMAKAGVIHLVTARYDDALIGYHIAMIHPHLHYKSSITAFTDIFYLAPAYRVGMVGYRMLKFMRDSVKDRGVQKIYMGTKLTHDIGPLLDRLGFKAIERIYSLVFR